MLEKEKIISKLNIKDYNNQLEKILSKKNFSEDTKNLLLNMLYKIENAYDDYSRVNRSVKTKKEILKEVLEIIEEDCEVIEIIRDKQSRSIPEEKKIITYLNARKMLYEIYQIRNANFKIFEDHEILKIALEDILSQGYSIDANEVIRDFDGWSWNIEVQEIENIVANLVFAVLKILVGYEFLNEWKDDNNKDYIIELTDNLEKKYKTEIAEGILKSISQVSILDVISKNKAKKERLIQIQEDLQKEFDELDNKKEYITKLDKKKKENIEEIKRIDSTINNDRKLKEEFIKRNELLDANSRIFSLSDLVEILEEEKSKLHKELNVYNKKMEPLNFVKTKTEIENKLTLLKELDLQHQTKKTYNSKVKELLKIVCEAFKIQINKAVDKETIINLIYQIRYFRQIYVDDKKQIKDIVDLNSIQKMIITKACKEKVITIFSKNIKENYEIVKHIFQSDIIELEEIYFKFIQEENRVLLELHDEDNIYKTIQIENIAELNVKLNKKNKVFI